MKASELRIGNWICFMDEVGESPLYIETEVNLMEIQKSIKDPDFFYGIPLTKELLIRFGFEEDGPDWYFMSTKDRFTDIGYSYSIKNNSFEVSDFEFVEVKYVHQLQNLYFALTGKELKLNEL